LKKNPASSLEFAPDGEVPGGYAAASHSGSALA
jgi:hypothetical protein